MQEVNGEKESFVRNSRHKEEAQEHAIKNMKKQNSLCIKDDDKHSKKRIGNKRFDGREEERRMSVW